MTSLLNHRLELDDIAQKLLFTEARTANNFTDEPVTDEQLEAIYELVKFAPTSMNMQPLRMIVVRSPEARATLVGHMAEGNRAKTAAAPAVVVLAADLDFHEEFHRTFPHFPGAKSLFEGDDASRATTARFNAALQVGYFILGVRAAGLAAGPMTGYDAEGINRDFFSGGAHEVLAVINLGKPGDSAWMDRLPRLEYQDVVETV